MLWPFIVWLGREEQGLLLIVCCMLVGSTRALKRSMICTCPGERWLLPGHLRSGTWSTLRISMIMELLMWIFRRNDWNWSKFGLLLKSSLKTKSIRCNLLIIVRITSNWQKSLSVAMIVSFLMGSILICDKLISGKKPLLLRF